MPSPTVRRAHQADLERLVPLFDDYRKFFTGSLQSGSREFLEQRLARQDSYIIVAFAGDHLCGFLQLYPLFSSWYATRIWFLSDLYVDDAYRKAGIGKSLVAAAQEFAAQNGSRSIMVEIPHSEPHLVEFYQNLRFERDKTFDLYRYYLNDST